MKIKGYLKPKKEESKTDNNLSEAIFGTSELFKELKSLQESVVEVVDKELEKIEETHEKIKDTTEKSIKKIDDKVAEFEETAIGLINDIKQFPTIKGDPGKEVDEEKLEQRLSAKIPKLDDFLSKIPKLDEDKLLKNFISKIPENKASLKIIQERFETDPMSVIDKILALPEDKLLKLKLKSSNIDGLDQTIRAMQHQLGVGGSKGYVHGGGISNITGLILADTGISITGSGTSASPYEISATGSGAGTVTEMQDSDTNGVEIIWTNPTTTPEATVVLGNITPNAVQVAGLTASEIVLTDASKNLVSASVATYPSLTELTYVKGVTSAIQTQINTKAPTASPTFTGTITTPLTASRALVTGASSELAVSTVTATELGYLSGATSSIQTQINALSSGGANTALSNLASVAVNTTLVSDTDNTDSLGTLAIAWSDLFLGNGAVINFTSAPSTSDVTITHSSNLLTIAGGALAMGGSKITGVADPTASQDAATMAYVDGLANGLKWKDLVRVATTTAGTLASDFENGDTVDGVVLATNDRILIKNQADPTENGIYIVAASGAPARSTDADTGAELVNATVAVTAGTANASKAFTQTTPATITIGVSNIVFVQFLNTAYFASTGLLLTGNTFSIDTTVVIGPGSATDNAIARYDGTTGKLLQNSGITISDAAVMAGVDTITFVSGGNGLISTPNSNSSSINITPGSAVSGSTTGGSVNLTAGNGFGQGGGGFFNVLGGTGGAGGAGGSGGFVVLEGGAGGAGGGQGGGIALYGGASSASNAAGGEIDIRGGEAHGSGTGGYINLTPGPTTSGSPGHVRLYNSDQSANLILSVLSVTGSKVATFPNATGTIVLADNTTTLSNKRITKRVVTVTQSATPTINTDNTDVAYITGLAQAVTSFTSNLSGTPVNGDTLIIDMTDNGTGRAITWGASFESSGNVTLPSTTVASTKLTIGFRYNVATSKWRCDAVS